MSPWDWISKHVALTLWCGWVACAGSQARLVTSYRALRGPSAGFQLQPSQPCAAKSHPILNIDDGPRLITHIAHLVDFSSTLRATRLMRGVKSRFVHTMGHNLLSFTSTRAQKEGNQDSVPATGGLHTTRSSRNAILLSSFFYFISVIFLILVSFPTSYKTNGN